MAKQQVVANFPDILGAITGGARFNVDVVQCALTVRPIQVPSGQTFELVLLLQNACDVNVDVALKTDLPARDLAKSKNPFTAKPEKLLIGLRPAEVGTVVLPVESAEGTQPGQGYTAALELNVKAVPKDKKQKPQMIREEGGGGAVKAQDLDTEKVDQMRALRALHWSAEAKGKKIQTPFMVVPPAAAGLTTPKAEWVSLWTLGDYNDDYTIAQSVWGPAQKAIAQLKRDQVFMPILKATQERFQASGYALLPPEAIYITKSMVLVLEQPITPLTPGNRQVPAWPRWFTKLIRVLAKQAALADQPDVLAAQHLYADLMYDTIVHGFSLVSSTTHENFGSPDEIDHYATDLVAELGQRQPMDMTRVYLPLVMTGVIANMRITMPREQVRETVFTLSKALERRAIEKTPDNAFIFDITNKLVEYALDMT